MKINSEEIITKSPGQTKRLAKSILDGLSGNVIALNGDLGSGKTTFVQGLAKTLGVKKRILSPTFILMRTYNLSESKFTNLHHLDLYRIENSRDVEGLGLPEIISDINNLVVIEWAEKAEHLLPQKKVQMQFEYIDENRRRVTVTVK
ncbi:MAG TPA: tRNA (adenosine(37)-N6)-threonylcarbamoyltransferase complex ATPase subunit type 1 TsaE [Patescibacteria group bacterium]|nr:tRNA (adenosine(37)-N6)-threonylcarbamoyltransferase complex ATPase subunit type 1 TsaE [Patescibacteria group bacterium]